MGDVTISGALMHAPFSTERGHHMAGLLDSMGRDNIQSLLVNFSVIEDWKAEGCWPTAKRAWLLGLEIKATHHFIIQDDIIVCDDFLLGLHKILMANPTNIVSLMSMPRKAFQNLDENIRWGVAEGVWGQGVVMPHETLSEFLVWEQENVNPDFKQDDCRISLFCVQTGKRVYVPFPNLIDHGDLKSTLGHPNISGSCIKRGAVNFIGDKSPLEFNWSVEQDNLAKSINSYTHYNKWLIR